jgi:hypothetical protein
MGVETAMEEVWERPFEVNGVSFLATFHRRPFREGLEVRCEVPSGTLRVSELGYGETALLELLKERVALELAEIEREDK